MKKVEYQLMNEDGNLVHESGNMPRNVYEQKRKKRQLTFRFINKISLITPSASRVVDRNDIV